MREIKEKIVDVWDIWSRNFYGAKRFFGSRGNIKTKSKLKDRWYKQFVKDLKSLTNKEV